MHRGGGGLPGSQVASRGSAGVWSDLQIVIIVYMTRCAGHVGVAVGQRKTGARMIEVRRIPTRRGVAVCAITYSENRAGGRMWRIVGVLPGGQVASRISAICRRDG